MVTKEIVGICRLCASYGLLSFEHVPPRAAYNAYPRFYPDTREFINQRVAGGPAPTIVHEPRGAGAHTLCGDCNNRCSRYARHFIEWAVAWQEALDSNAAAESVGTTQRCRRSRIMKQIVAMFLSANPPEMGRIHHDLRRFVWNAEHRGLPAGIHVYAALTRDPDARQAGVTGKMDMSGKGASSIFSEIAFAPLILVMTFNDAEPPDPRLLDITFFASAGYKEQPATELRLAVLRLRDIYPGAYH